MAIRKNLVLGGSGTIGSVLCKELKAQGEEVMRIILWLWPMGFLSSV